MYDLKQIENIRYKVYACKLINQVFTTVVHGDTLAISKYCAIDFVTTCAQHVMYDLKQIENIVYACTINRVFSVLIADLLIMICRECSLYYCDNRVKCLQTQPKK